jgi:hypothetical protein
MNAVQICATQFLMSAITFTQQIPLSVRKEQMLQPIAATIAWSVLRMFAPHSNTTIVSQIFVMTFLKFVLKPTILRMNVEKPQMPLRNAVTCAMIVINLAEELNSLLEIFLRSNKLMYFMN